VVALRFDRTREIAQYGALPPLDMPYIPLPTESDTAALPAQAIALQLCCAFSFATAALGLSVVSLGGLPGSYLRTGPWE
jgi:hypothetical protein